MPEGRAGSQRITWVTGTSKELGCDVSGASEENSAKKLRAILPPSALMLSDLESKSWRHLTGHMEEACETSASRLGMNLAEVMSKLAGSFCLMEQLMPIHTCP